MSTAAESELSLLSDLVQAASSAHTRKALARKVAGALAGHFPLRLFELGWFVERGDDEEGEGESAAVVSLELPSSKTGETTEPREPEESHRDLADSLAREALRGARPLVLPVTGKGSHLTPEEKAAAALGCERIVLLPLLASDGEAEREAGGFALLGFASPRGRRGAWPSPGLLSAIARTLAVLQRQGRLVERVAALSRSAHVETAHLRRELDARPSPGPIVARSEAMRRALEKADLVAATGTTVLLRGESGTGKELLAERIHRLSPRRDAPFLRVNCGALPEALVESELFGHEKGAFTGATARHLGRFERANGGTLLLDEVAELPPSAQVKLLRVLQQGEFTRPCGRGEGSGIGGRAAARPSEFLHRPHSPAANAEFERVGGEETVRVDVRVIAATHRPLAKLVRRGAFRADLYYRLDVFPIRVPPLRERRDDLEPLALALLEGIARRLGRTPPRLTARAVARLLERPWKGNVRELANVLERAAILSRGEELELPEADLEPEEPPSPRERSGNIGKAERLDDALRRCIALALSACRGRVYGKRGAASRLGLRPTTLQGKMRRLGMRRADFVPRGA